MLANAGSDVLSQLERFKESFLWAAAKGGRVEECESLVQMGTDVNWVSPEGDTPLLAACRNGHVTTALCLLSHGASVNQAAKDGQTALHLACRHGKEAVAEALILGGADVSVRDHVGATAFERQGPNAPDGMLNRLTTVLQQTTRQHRFHQGISIETDITTATTASADGVSPQGGGPAIHNDHSIFDTETLRTPVGGGRLGSGHFGRSGWSNRRSTENRQRQSHLMDDADDGAGGVGSAAGPVGGRDDTHRDAEVRTTFPSISRKVGSANGGRRRSSSIRSDRRGRSFASGEQGFHSSDDDDDENELLSEDETRTRSFGGLYRGPDGRQPGTLPTRSRTTDNVDDFPESMRLISAGEPVPRASAAIAAAIASASAAAASAPSRSTTAANAALSTTTAATLAGAASSPTSISPRRSFDVGGTTAAAWDGAGADGGGGHGVIFGSSGSSNSSSSGSSSCSSRGGDGGIQGRSNSRSGERQPGSALATSSTHHPQAATLATSGAIAIATAAATARVYDSLATNTASEIVNGGSITAARLSPQVAVETRRPRGRHDEPWAAGAGVRLRSGDPLCAATDARAGGRPGRFDQTGRMAGGMRRGDGFGIDKAEEEDASNDHVGLIRALWLQEKEGRLASEAKADAVREQGARLWNELVRSEKQVLRLEEGMAGLREERDKLKATLNGEGVKGRSLQELEQLEKDLRKALEGVCGERDRIVQDQLVKEEQRLCVVCQENERGVLLLPCRHLCVCRGCSERPELTLCPLCRDHIAESLVVYS